MAGKKKELTCTEAVQRYHCKRKDVWGFTQTYGRMPTREECENGLKTKAMRLKLSKTREYWTELDGFCGLYEISNWGRIRSTQTHRLAKLLSINEVRGRNKGNYGGAKVYCSITVKKKTKVINVMKEVLRHFGGYDGVHEVALIDSQKPPTIDNIRLTERRRSQCENNQKSNKKLTSNDWLILGQAIKLFTNEHIGLYSTAGVEQADIEHEMLCQIAESWDGQELTKEQLKDAETKAILKNEKSKKEITIERFCVGTNFGYYE